MVPLIVYLLGVALRANDIIFIFFHGEIKIVKKISIEELCVVVPVILPDKVKSREKPQKRIWVSFP